MVSNRSRYVSESTSDDETGDMDYVPTDQNKPARKPTRTPKCFSKNALMARENRLKKKIYISSLETQLAALKHENKKLSHVVDNQAGVIDELKKEVKYLKSVLANSESIGKLIQAINTSTGLPIATSLNRRVPNVTPREIVNRSPIAEKTVPQIQTSKPTKEIVYNKAFDPSRHPWEEKDPGNTYVNYPTPESTTTSCYGSPEIEELENEGLLFDINDLPIEMDDSSLLNMIDEKALESPMIPMEEHNYHSPEKCAQGVVIKEEDDVGVCLHVSKNKLSLEFCPSCSDNAAQNWS